MLVIKPRNPSAWYRKNIKRWTQIAKTKGCPRCNAPPGLWCQHLGDLKHCPDMSGPITTQHRERGMG